MSWFIFCINNLKTFLLTAAGDVRCDSHAIQLQIASDVSHVTAAEMNWVCVSVCVLPSCVPQQAGLFTEGLRCSLTKKTLIQHIPNMFTYREGGGGGEKAVCVCERADMISSHWPSVCVVCACVCVTASAEPTRKWLLYPICQVIGWEAVKRASSDCQKCKQGKGEGFTERGTGPREGWGSREERDTTEEPMKFSQMGKNKTRKKGRKTAPWTPFKSCPLSKYVIVIKGLFHLFLSIF